MRRAESTRGTLLMSTSWLETGDPRPGYQRAVNPLQSRTDRRPVAKKNLRTTVGALAVVAAVGGSAPPWPPFLPARGTFSPHLAGGGRRGRAGPTAPPRVGGGSASRP